MQLFHENQDIAWLDKIEKRYAWLKRHLLDFEDKYGKIFPYNWELSERITIEFCMITRNELSKVMSKRRTEIDVKLLLYAIAKTSAFEILLAKRFSGVTIIKTDNNNISSPRKQISGKSTKPSPQSDTTSSLLPPSPFFDLIGICFKPYLDIYTNSVDKNLAEILDRFVQDSKHSFDPIANESTVFPNCADLFVFFKKCMVQCAQLSNAKPMHDLAIIFKKYLREYASKILEYKIPKMRSTHTSIGSSMSLLTKDLQNLSTAAGQVIHSLLKEDETLRYTKEEIIRLCCILTTAEYCLETVEQLEDKLKEKISIEYVDKIDLSEEKNIFHRIISNCTHLLVQEMENGCEPALIVMSKVKLRNFFGVFYR